MIMSTDMQNENFEDYGFDFDDVDPDKPGSGGGGAKLPEGGYCLLVTAVVVQNDKGRTEIDAEVLVAKDAALVGRTHKEYLNWPQPGYSDDGKRISKENLLAWCYAAETTTAEEVKRLQQERKGFNPAWLEKMVGKRVLAFVKSDEYEGKPQAKIEGRVWAMTNPKGERIPGYLPPTHGHIEEPKEKSKPADAPFSEDDLV